MEQGPVEGARLSATARVQRRFGPRVSLRAAALDGGSACWLCAADSEGSVRRDADLAMHCPSSSRRRAGEGTMWWDVRGRESLEGCGGTAIWGPRPPPLLPSAGYLGSWLSGRLSGVRGS